MGTSSDDEPLFPLGSCRKGRKAKHAPKLSLYPGMLPPATTSIHSERKRASGPMRTRDHLINTLFPHKRKAPPQSAPAATSSAPRPTPAAIQRGVEILRSIFPKWEEGSLQLVLETQEFIMEDAITTILKMEEVDDACAHGDGTMQHEPSLPFVVKNPLPDDFLRLPDDDDHESDKQSVDSSRTAQTRDEDDDEEEDEEEMKPSTAQEGDDLSERSSAVAEDDGTLYGKEIGAEQETFEDDLTPPTPIFRNEAHASIISDSMNQRFIPAEIRQPRMSILDTSNIDVIRRSKLNITEAENRIRHREPHLIFELLSKASEMYRNGIISSKELEHLRSMILARIQPSKMLIDMSMNMDEMISDHEWHLLILRAKGIRPALSVRVIQDKKTSSAHMEYIIRVADVETGIIWIVRKRFREFYRLHRKLSRLSSRLSDCDFPPRRNSSRIPPSVLAAERAPLLENFLRQTASVVSPSPLTFLNGCVLKHFQQFLILPDEVYARTRPLTVTRMLRVYVFHTLSDETSPEGKACSRFLRKMRQINLATCGDILEELGGVLDGVQEYMLEHRFEEMKMLVLRMIKHESSNVNRPSSMGCRTHSFVNLTSDDVLANTDKLQQVISDAIRCELEDSLYIPLMHNISDWLSKKLSNKERQFQQRVYSLKGKPQSFFGIPMDKISISSWRVVVDSMKDVEGALLPLDKLRKLVASAHQIHTLYKSERAILRNSDDGSASSSQNGAEQTTLANADPPVPASDTQDVLSGDDFLPIFIYVIVQSDLRTPIQTQVLLNRLCDPEKRRSESGYYLATFEAALHHILSSPTFDAPM